jgi:hypothetical protein
MWVQLRWGLLALFVSLISPCLLCAQSPECVDQSSAVSHQSKKIKINIVGVEFREKILFQMQRAQNSQRQSNGQKSKSLQKNRTRIGQMC